MAWVVDERTGTVHGDKDTHVEIKGSAVVINSVVVPLEHAVITPHRNDVKRIHEEPESKRYL